MKPWSLNHDRGHIVRASEDHDGPFVFDTANTLKLVNLRARTGSVLRGQVLLVCKAREMQDLGLRA